MCVCACVRAHVQGSRDQLKEVWKETDGLDPDDFDPKIFFKLHGNHRPDTCCRADPSLCHVRHSPGCVWMN